MHSGNVKNQSIIFIVVLIITLSALYWKTFNYEFIWDSKIYFKQNILFTENYPLSSAFKLGYFHGSLGKSNIEDYYRPLLAISFIIENKVWGLKNPTLRLINVFIYILGLIFLYYFLKLHSKKKYFPEITTLLFALYPLNVDNIVWIVGRGDLLLLLWGSLTFLFLGLFIKKGKYYYLIASSFFYLLGIFSKETFLFFLPVLFLYEFVKRKKISIPYHMAIVLMSTFFFVLKSKILGIQNLRIVFPSNILENIKIVVSSLGYYFRSAVFPVYHDFFIPLQNVVNLAYILSGILFILFLVLLLYQSRRDSEVIIPLSFIVFFTGGVLLLLFTDLFPFKLYARYMMIPALGFIWIFVKYIGRLRERVRLTLAFVVLLVFILSTVINTYSYKSELIFFNRANTSFPENGYILFQMTKILYERQDYLAAELALYKALSCKQSEKTAILLSLYHASIEHVKADYNKALKRIEEIENLESYLDIQLAPFTRFLINNQKAMVSIDQGNINTAEKLLKENIKQNKNIKEPYKMLYQMYVGQNMWEKASNLEQIMIEQFPSFAVMNTTQIKNHFNSLPAKEKITFYVQYKNYRKAIDIIKTFFPLSLNNKILHAKLTYWEGNEDEAKNIIEDIFSDYSNDFRVMNKIGDFYLKDLIRVEEALFYYKKSLEINKNQPEVSILVFSLIENYLNKLKEF